MRSRRIVSLLTMICLFVAAMSAKEVSFTISFGAQTPSSNSLTNDSFLSAVTAGKSYIANVTSVVSVFPETDALKLSSSKTAGKFNIHLTEAAQVKAKRIEIKAYRYDNDRDAEAALMINSETILIPSTVPDYYEVEMVARPLKTLTNLIVDATCRVYLQEITVVYDDAEGVVPPKKFVAATPVFTPEGGKVAAGTLVSISCDTPGAEIYYTLDGSLPTADSMLFTSPIEISAPTIINAVAMCEGYDASEVATAEYTIGNADVDFTASFDFTNPESLNPSVSAPQPKEWVELDGKSFSAGVVAVSFAATGLSNTHVRLYGSYDAGCNLRVYDGDSFTVKTLNSNYRITDIAFDVALTGETPDIDLVASEGRYEWLTNSWTADGDDVSEVTFTSVKQSRISTMNVTLAQTSGIEDLTISGDNAPESWYNISGLRMDAPSVSGIYLRKKGSRVEKVIIR